MEQKKWPLVSMITYCYNGERFIHKYFEAVLAQTYDNIELIFIDNGSQDGTWHIAQSYLPKLEGRGIQTQLIRKETNQATCAMKKLGFELMHGDYFFGCDSDDLIHPTYIEKMLGYLVDHPEKGVVFCQLRAVLETTGEQIGLMKINPNPNPKGAFIDLLCARNAIFTPISYMISREHFLQVNPKMDIYISRYGENYQIQLPLLYADLQGYIEEPLGDYSIRYDSYTGKLKKDPIKQINAYRGQEESIIATLEQMELPNATEFYPYFQVRLRSEALFASLSTKDRGLRKECYGRLKAVHGITPKIFISYRLLFVRTLLLKLLRREKKGE